MPKNSFAPVVDTSHSPHVRLQALSVDSFRLNDAFWSPRIAANRTVTLPTQYRLLWETGRLRNFQRAAGKIDVPFEGIYFNDSDVYKWMEAAAWVLAGDPDSELRGMLDESIEVVAAAQSDDGYLNTFFSVDRVAERWTNHDLHEMYCAGHLFQAAVAHFRVTQSHTLLNVACRFADHICKTFGPAESGRREWVCGHEEIEMALVELYRVTNEKRYLDQAAYFINARGRNMTRHGEVFQDNIPYRETKNVAGHAVRAMYLECAAADLYAETGETALREAIDVHWNSAMRRRMYVTGGVGSRWAGEVFGNDYELPNDTAYAESCAAIGSLMWNWRMLQITGEARFAEIIELALYNGILSGLSLDGQQYYYQNPLADNGAHRRQAWFGCACCPPNISRMLASLTGYFASVSDGGVWLHLWAAGHIDAAIPGGERIGLDIATRYPWDGRVEITVTDAPATPVSLNLRIPAWATGATVAGDAGSTWPCAAGQYAELTQVWRTGDKITLTLPMPVRRIEANPAIDPTAGRVALARGPLVYAIEQADYADADIRLLCLPSNSPLASTWRDDLLGGVEVVTGEGLAHRAPDWDGELYRTIETQSLAPVNLTAIPYYAWANRAAGPMRVWIPSA
ncbi:MAG: glycoside hydrolase family 127 protein [Capsulimonadaceae bacterium]|nr:glycoside hydrolase family 127 protein [Capsulimonadaceae bacterium]